MFLVYNSDILLETDFRLSITDRAFQYGDGLFETIRYEQNRVWFWPDHFDRLSEGMDALQLKSSTAFSAEVLYGQILQLLASNGLSEQAARIKIQVWRQPGGLYTPTQNSANVLITARPGNRFSITERAKTGIYENFRLYISPVSAVKTLNALPYVMAGLFREQNHFDEVILLDTAGNVAECLASNLFWFSGQTLFTPSLQTGCINGIIRRQLLRLAPEMGINVAEVLDKPDTVATAEAVFCANVMGIQWLRSLNDVTVDHTAPSSINALTLLNALFAQLHR